MCMSDMCVKYWNIEENLTAEIVRIAMKYYLYLLPSGDQTQENDIRR